MDTFNLKKFLVENKLTQASKLTEVEMGSVKVGDIVDFDGNWVVTQVHEDGSIDLYELGEGAATVDVEGLSELEVIGFLFGDGSKTPIDSYDQRKQDLINPGVEDNTEDEDLYEDKESLRQIRLARMDPEAHSAQTSSKRGIMRLAKDERYGLSPLGWRDRKDRPYGGSFDFDYDEEEFGDYDSYRAKYPNHSDHWFAPGEEGRRLFDKHKPIRVRTPRRLEETHSAKDKLPPAVIKKLDSMSKKLAGMKRHGKTETQEYKKLNKEYLALEKKHGL